MGDMSAEPSMEEILSSIKRIIAEESDGAPIRQRRASRATPPAPIVPEIEDDLDEDDEEEILELSDPMPHVERAQPRAARAVPEPAPAPAIEAPRPAAAAPAPTPAPNPAPSFAPEAPSEPIMSRETVAATRAPLEALTRMMVKPEPGSDGTLEGLVRDMLRPILREWIDAHLPGMVEEMVAREIKKITGQPG